MNSWESVVSQPSDIPDNKLEALGAATQTTLLKYIDASPNCMERIVGIHTSVTKLIGDISRVHRAKLYTFGSSVVYGFVEPGSDIDFVFLSEKVLRMTSSQGDDPTPQARSDQNFVLGMIAKVLKGKPEFQKVEEMPRARVPFVRCVMSGGQEVDISASRRNGVRNSLLLKSYFTQPQCGVSRWLALAVKVWAKRCGLIDPNQAFLTSYALNVLVIYYLLQRKEVSFIEPNSIEIPKSEPVLPKFSPLVETNTTPLVLGTYMRDFLRFYNREYDYANHVVSLSKPLYPVGLSGLTPRATGVTTKAMLDWTLPDEEKSRAMSGTFWYRLCIEDPYEEKLNLGRFVTPMKYGSYRTAMHGALGNGLGFF